MTFVLVTWTRGDTTKQCLIRAPLNVRTAEWVAGAFRKGGGDHPLHAQLPAGSFEAHAVLPYGHQWVITFSRRREPVYLEVRGRRVGIAGSDTAAVRVTLSTMECLAAVDIPSYRRSSVELGTSTCAAMPLPKSPHSSPRT